MISGLWARAALLAATSLVLPSVGEAGWLTITWNPNDEADLAGYSVHYGTQPGTYTAVIDAGQRTSVTIPSLIDGQRYYVAVRAYTGGGTTSSFSAEVSHVVAAPAPHVGLVAAYGFEETGGLTVDDASPHGNRGTITGATRTASGRYGRALSFDGVDDVVTIADAVTLDLSTAMTIQAWVRPAALTGAGSVLVKEAADTVANYALYASHDLPLPTASIAVEGTAGGALAAAATPLPLGTWTHLAATFDGLALRVYVNAALVATEPVPGMLRAADGALRIAGTAWGGHFNGAIDEVRVHNRALSEAEIARDMNAPVVTGLVAAYGFEEAAGTVANDASGSGHHGTIAGAARVAGRFGRGLSFDGADDVVTVADSAALDGTQLTVSAWVYPTALSGWRTAVMKEAPNGMVYSLYAHDNAPRPALTIAFGGVDHATGGAAPLPLNVWSHLAATYDGATVRLFLNGTEVGHTALAGALSASADPLRIGGNSVWGEYFSGRIDEVRIYNRPLSPIEIQREMNLALVP
jgi:hypothetical protein